MAAARKKKKNFLFGIFSSKKKNAKKSRKKNNSTSFVAVIKIFSIFIFVAAVGIGFIYLDKYVKKQKTGLSGTLILVNSPQWFNDQLGEKIYQAATTGGEDLLIDVDIAQSVQKNITTYCSWVYDVKVAIAGQDIRINCKWRKPLCEFSFGSKYYLIGADMVAMEYLEMDTIDTIKIQGIANLAEKPILGKVWQKPDVAAAVVIIDNITLAAVTEEEKKMLTEIDSINVKNFQGIQNPTLPHITLNTTDKTEIIWGAEFGKWQRNLEVSDNEKISRLFSFYKQRGSLLGGLPYITLYPPDRVVPLPSDKY